MLFKRPISLLSLLGLSFALSACHVGAQYTYFLQNPEVLKTAVSRCNGQRTEYCQQAYASAQALSDFQALASSKRQLFLQAQEAGPGQMTTQTRQMLIEAEMNTESLFGQHIMLMQSKLSKMKEALPKVSGQDRAALLEQIRETDQRIQAMLAIAWLNNPEG